MVRSRRHWLQVRTRRRRQSTREPRRSGIRRAVVTKEQQPGSVVLLLKRSHCTATNQPRHGYERKRSQLKTKTMGQKHWIKRSRQTGEFMDQKKVGKFKSVRREKDGR